MEHVNVIPNFYICIFVILQKFAINAIKQSIIISLITAIDHCNAS